MDTNTKEVVTTENKKAVNKTDKKATKPKKKGFRFFKYLKEVKAEFTTRIVWPSAKQVAKNTLVVLAVVAVVGVFISLLDLGLTQLISLILNRG